MHRLLSPSPVSTCPRYPLSPSSIRILRRRDGAIPRPYPVYARPPNPLPLGMTARDWSGRNRRGNMVPSLALCLLPAARFAVSAPACRRFPPIPPRPVGAPQFPLPHRVSAICLASSPSAQIITGLPFSQRGRHESLHGAPVSGGGGVRRHDQWRLGPAAATRRGENNWRETRERLRIQHALRLHGGNPTADPTADPTRSSFTFPTEPLFATFLRQLT